MPQSTNAEGGPEAPNRSLQEIVEEARKWRQEREAIIQAHESSPVGIDNAHREAIELNDTREYLRQIYYGGRDKEALMLDRILSQGVSKKYVRASRADIPANVLDLFVGWDRGEGYYVYGGVGTGKTHIASALVADAVRAGATTLPEIISVPNLLLDIRDTYSRRRDMSEEELINYYSYAPALVLDDLGVEKPTDWAVATLWTIVNTRYNDQLQTMFTSNLSLDQLVKHYDGDDRITSRIAEMCTEIKLTGKDRRLGK